MAFFTHKITSKDEFLLGDTERAIFRAVIERKQHISQRGVVTSGYRWYSGERPTPRRSEEKFKFVIKRIIKHLKKRDGIRSDRQFYDTYFSRVSATLGIPLDRFYDPHNKVLANSGYKSLSTDYVMLLLRSDIFMLEMLHYLERRLLAKHIESLHAKVANLCRKWEAYYYTLDANTRSVDAIITIILKTEKGSKLPWSVDEVRESMELMRSAIFSCNTQRFMR